MNPVFWFIVLVTGFAVFGMITSGFEGLFIGASFGFVLWCVGGLFWLVNDAVDTTYDSREVFSSQPLDTTTQRG